VIDRAAADSAVDCDEMPLPGPAVWVQLPG
jgi:hypothetical protein